LIRSFGISWRFTGSSDSMGRSPPSDILTQFLSKQVELFKILLVKIERRFPKLTKMTFSISLWISRKRVIYFR